MINEIREGITSLADERERLSLTTGSPEITRQLSVIYKKTISQIVKEFISNDLFAQRKTLIQLLMKDNDPEFQYLAYLLYDLLSTENNGTFDTMEQTILFDSLPWTIKKYFRDAMKTTIKYTKNLSNFDLEFEVLNAVLAPSIHPTIRLRIKNVEKTQLYNVKF